MQNSTHNATQPPSCEFGRIQNLSLTFTDVFTFLIGQPVITKLLWVTFTSKKDKDVLNCNLALFHSFQYLLCLFHLISLYVQPQFQMQILKFMLVYIEIGGPMNLSLICMQRYVAVIHPMSYPLLKKYRCREICAVMVWIVSVPVAFESTFGPDDIASFKNYLINTISFTVMVVMTALTMRLSIQIALTLKRSSPMGERLSPSKRRAFTIVYVTSCINLCSYIPVALVLKFNQNDGYTYECKIIPACVLLLSAVSVVHPLFYVSSQRKTSA